MENQEIKVKGTLTLRLKPNEVEELNKLIHELGEKSASKTIVRLFYFYYRYNRLQEQHDALVLKNKGLERKYNDIKEVFRNLFDVTRQILDE